MTPIQRGALARLSNLSAMLGGTLLTGIALMSVYSVFMRNALGKPIQGDFELVQVACAASIAAFMPLCHLKGGHIIVDFFTTKASPLTRARLDAVGALLLGAVFALLAWRTGAGALDAYRNDESSMMMGFPLWIGYAAMVPSLILAAVIGLLDGVQRMKAPAPKKKAGAA
jgi:TRAP-type C4-dicarboxylate transport system permease small subunit